MKILPNQRLKRLILGIFLLAILAVVSIFGVKNPSIQTLKAQANLQAEN